MGRRLWQQGGKGVVVPGCAVGRKRIKPLTLHTILTELWLWKTSQLGQDAGDGGDRVVIILPTNSRSEDQPHDDETERGSAAQGDARRKNRESPWHFRLYLNSPAANTLGPVRPRRRSIPESMANPKS